MRFGICSLFSVAVGSADGAASPLMDVSAEEAFVNDDCTVVHPASSCVDGVCKDMFWISADSQYYMVDIWNVLEGAPSVSPLACEEAATMLANDHAIQYMFNFEAFEAKLGRLMNLVSGELMGALSRYPLEPLEAGQAGPGGRTLMLMATVAEQMRVTAESSEETAAANRAFLRTAEFQIYQRAVEQRTMALTMLPFSPHASVPTARIAPFLWLLQDIRVAGTPTFAVETGMGAHILAKYPAVYRDANFVGFFPATLAALEPVPMLGALDPIGATQSVEAVRRIVQAATDVATRRAQGQQVLPGNVAAAREMIDSFASVMKMLASNLGDLGVDPATLGQAHEALLLLRVRMLSCASADKVVAYMRWIEAYAPSYPIGNHVIASFVGLCKLTAEVRIGASVMAPGRHVAAADTENWRRHVRLTTSRDEAEIMAQSIAFLTGRDANTFWYDLVVGVEDVGRMGYLGPRKLWINQMIQHFTAVSDNSSFEYADAFHTSIRLTSLVADTAVRDEKLVNLRATGRVVGYALRHGVSVGMRCSPSFIKQLALLANPSAEVDYDAIIDGEDAEFRVNLNKLTELDPETLADMEMTFEGLVAGGAEIPVTVHNLADYIQLAKVQSLFFSRGEALHVFAKGVADVAGSGLFYLLTETELQERLCARPGGLTAELLKAGVERRNFNPAIPEHVNLSQWLNEIIDEMTEEERIKFHLFVTGTRDPPVVSRNWIKAFIEPALASNSLPRSHTCHNELQLPLYETKAQMREKVLLAISETGSIEGHVDYQVAQPPPN